MGKVVLKIGRWKLTEGAKGPSGTPLFPATRISAPGTPLSPTATPSATANSEVHFARPVEAEPPPPSPSLDQEIIPNGHEPLATLKEENSMDLASPETAARTVSSSPPPTAESPETSLVLEREEENLTESKPQPELPPSPSVEPPKPTMPRPLVTIEAATPEQSHAEKEPEESEEEEVKLIPGLSEDGSEIQLVELKKVANQQLGMGIGKRARGILITSLQAKSVAADSLKIGDRILAVNGVEVTDQQSAVTLVKNSGDRLVLQIGRPKEEPQTR